MSASQEIVDARTREEWAAVINADWRKSIEGIIQTGNDLIQAKAELPNGQFGFMIKDDLCFGPRTAQRLMQISRHPEIGNATPASHLPQSWVVLHELTNLTPGDFRAAVAEGLIGSETTKRQARQLAADERPEGMLPVPTEARRMAKESGKFVAASDGNIYSGASEEEGAEATRRRDQTYGAVDAIETLSEMPEADRWLAETEHWQLREFDQEKAKAAAAWLAALIAKMENKNGK